MLLLLTGDSPGDSIVVRHVPRLPAAADVVDTTSLGLPQIRLATGQGTASLWLVAASDTVVLVAAMPDTTPEWTDDLLVSLDLSGSGGAAPGHDDFQWDFRRLLDSSVIYCGRSGRWEPPQDDPDWRLGARTRLATRVAHRPSLSPALSAQL